MDDRERSELLERVSLEFAKLIFLDDKPYPSKPRYDGLPLQPRQRSWSKIRFYGFSPDVPEEGETSFSYGWVSKICGLRSDGRYFAVGVYLIDGFEFEDPETVIKKFLKEGWEYFDSYRCCSCGLINESTNSPCLLHGTIKPNKSVN